MSEHPRPGDRATPRRDSPSARSSRPTGTARRLTLAKIPTSAACYLPGGQPSRQWARSSGILGARAVASADRRERPRRLLSRADRRGDRRVLAGRRRSLLAEGLRRSHQSTWVDPVSTNYRGYDVWELPPNGQGIAALQMLNLLEPYDLKAMGPLSAESLHLMIEAKKLAYEDRARYYADPEFSKVPVATLISKPYAAERRPSSCSLDRANEHPTPGEPAEADTIYMTVVDRDRNCVSLIQSNFHGFGSMHVPGTLGFALQNRGCLFALDPSHANRLEPHKRPFHTIIPGVRHEGRQAVAELRPDGRRHAGSGACASHLRHDRLRHGCSGSRRRPSVPPFRLLRTHRPTRQGRRNGRSRIGHWAEVPRVARSEGAPASRVKRRVWRLSGDPH